MSFITLDGTSGRIDVTGYFGVTGDRPRSVSFWINTGREYGTICWWGTDPDVNIADGEQNSIRLSGGHIQIFGRGSYRESSTYVSDSTPYHGVITWTAANAAIGHEDFSQANIYINSVLDNGRVRGGSNRKIRADGSQSTDIEVDTALDHSVIIGARPTISGGFTDHFQGAMDDFAIYNVALAPATVTSIYNSGNPDADLSAIDQFNALELWYKMGDGVGDTAPAGTMMDQQPFVVARNGITSSGTGIVIA